MVPPVRLPFRIEEQESGGRDFVPLARALKQLVPLTVRIEGGVHFAHEGFELFQRAVRRVFGFLPEGDRFSHGTASQGALGGQTVSRSEARSQAGIFAVRSLRMGIVLLAM